MNEKYENSFKNNPSILNPDLDITENNGVIAIFYHKNNRHIYIETEKNKRKIYVYKIVYPTETLYGNIAGWKAMNVNIDDQKKIKYTIETFKLIAQFYKIIDVTWKDINTFKGEMNNNCEKLFRNIGEQDQDISLAFSSIDQRINFKNHSNKKTGCNIL